MQLPIDLRKAPFKPKYILDETEMLSEWFVFGTHVTDGTTWVTGGNCGNVDVFEGCSKIKAAAICELRNKFCKELLEILNER